MQVKASLVMLLLCKEDQEVVVTNQVIANQSGGVWSIGRCGSVSCKQLPAVKMIHDLKTVSLYEGKNKNNF